MSGRTQLVIAGHWHTGTSVIAKTFAACGMAVGNSNTYWKPEYEAQCEQGEINWYGDQAWKLRQESFNGLLPDRIEEILSSYIGEAELQDWRYYGIKTTHFLQLPCLAFLFPVFYRIWPKAVYIVPFRHPYEVILSTASDWKWSAARVMESYKSALEGYESFLKASASGIHLHLLKFPDCFYDGSIGALFDRLKMKMGEGPWDPAKVHHSVNDYLNDDGYKQFEKDYGDIIDGYESI